jgi:cell shape-determining protein MreC
LKSASDEDMKNINQYFDKKIDSQEQKRIEAEMEQLQREIDSLEEVNSGL